MTLTFELGTSSVDAVTIRPEWESKFGKRQNRSTHRARTGALYNYIWGDFEKIRLPVRFVPSSDASVVNEWWDAGTLLLLFITSGGATDVRSVQVLNTETPLREFDKPYADLYKGTIELEGY